MKPSVRLAVATEPLLHAIAGKQTAAMRTRLRRAGVRGLLFADLDAAIEATARVRAAQLLLAVRCDPALNAPAALAPLLASGPVLALVSASTTLADTAKWLAEAARMRHPMLRLAFAPGAHCHGGGWRGDLDVVILDQDPPELVSHPDCQRCALAGICPGAIASAEVRAQDRAVSNQFDLIPSHRWPLPKDAPAVVQRAIIDRIHADQQETPAEVQPLYAVVEHELWRCVCDNEGWGAEELAEVRDQLGQIWLDRSDKARLDDFERDLSAMRERLDTASGARWWRAAEENPFEDAERTLFATLAEARGVVVDVGAGPIRYLSLLRDRIAAGQVTYLAVEPDLDALERTAAELPGANLCRGVGEHLPLPDNSVDWVLMLRSYNHLTDVAGAVAEASRVCRPGGQLVIVDNVAFGLIRSQQQVERARSISADVTPFEHYRNANADEAVSALVADGGWSITQVEAVAPVTANQWFVRATRRESSGAVA